VRGPLPCPHFIAEEAPDQLLAEVLPFLTSGDGNWLREVKPGGQIVSELVEEARQIISQQLAGLVATQASQG
jgi:hypothetical protein